MVIYVLSHTNFAIILDPCTDLNALLLFGMLATKVIKWKYTIYGKINGTLVFLGSNPRHAIDRVCFKLINPLFEAKDNLCVSFEPRTCLIDYSSFAILVNRF